MSDQHLQQIIDRIDAINEDLRASLAAARRTTSHAKWRARINEAEARAAASLEESRARITKAGDQLAIRLAGIRSTSTMGMSGALSNWLSAARRRNGGSKE